MRFAVRMLLPLALTGGFAEAQTGAFGFHDIGLIDTSEIRIVDAPRAPPIFREPEVRLDAEDAPPSPDPSLGRAEAQLALDSSAWLEQPVPRGASQPTAAPLIEFTLIGHPIRMLAIEGRSDPDFDAFHITLLATASDDYARLTVSRSGPEIAGSVNVGNRWYRILPDDFDAEYQLVYPIGVRDSPWQRETPADLGTRAGQLEARHLQMAWVAETQPDVFATFSDGRPQEYRGPSLGVLDFWDSMSFDPAGAGTVDESLLTQEATRFLTEAHRFTWVYDRIEVELEPRFAIDLNAMTANGFAIELRQLINGIPISRSLRLAIDPTGEVVEYAGTLMPHAFGGPYGGSRITQEEARATGQAALRNRHGIETTGEPLEEQLFYNVILDTELELIWRMTLEAKCGMVVTVDVDGITGETGSIGVQSGGPLNDPRFPGFRPRTTDDLFLACRLSGSR
ncbi:MAG TPA: hypothetical protein VMR74_06310 [Gammaproteobacteria bacterium]|nr:hypothetical protein [Gammaproteobacteria bacterium]